MDTHSPSTGQRLGEILVRQGVCGSAAIRDACAVARISKRRLGAVLVESGNISDKELVEALAEQHNAQPLFSLSSHTLSPESRNILSMETAILQKTLLFNLTENSMSAASYDPAASDIFKAMIATRDSFITPYILPRELFMWGVILTYQAFGTSGIELPETVEPVGVPRIPASVRRAVVRHLTDSSRTIRFERGSFSMGPGNVGIHTQGVIETAWLFGVISVSEDGAITACGERLPFQYDTRKIRRKIEEVLRKNTCSRDLMRFAAILGADME